MTDCGYLHLKSDSFAKTPADLIHSAAITDGAFRLYGHMRWRYGDDMLNREGRASMSSMLGVSETTITNRAHQLEQADWIVIVPRITANGRKSNTYHVFEDQDDCRAYRAQNGYEKPVVDNLPERKSRAGTGGRPSHKSKLKPDEPTKLEFEDRQPKETQVEGGQKLEFTAPLNSGLPPVSRISFDLDSGIPYGLPTAPIQAAVNEVTQEKTEPAKTETNSVQGSETSPKVPAKGSPDVMQRFTADRLAASAVEQENKQRADLKVITYKWVSGHIHDNPKYVFTGHPIPAWRLEPGIWSCRLDDDGSASYADLFRRAKQLILDAPDDLVSHLSELQFKELVYHGGNAEHAWTYALAYFGGLSSEEIAALRQPATPPSLPTGEGPAVREFTPSPPADRGPGGEVNPPADLITVYGKRGNTYHVIRKGDMQTVGGEPITNLTETPNDGTKYRLCAKCDRALHPPTPRPEVPIILSYYYAIPDTYRPARPAFSEANIADALALIERGINADAVTRYVKSEFEGYAAWARAKGKPVVMSFSHVASKVAAWLTEHPKPSDQMEKSNNGSKHHPNAESESARPPKARGLENIKFPGV